MGRIFNGEERDEERGYQAPSRGGFQGGRLARSGGIQGEPEEPKSVFAKFSDYVKSRTVERANVGERKVEKYEDLTRGQKVAGVSATPVFLAKDIAKMWSSGAREYGKGLGKVIGLGEVAKNQGEVVNRNTQLIVNLQKRLKDEEDEEMKGKLKKNIEMAKKHNKDIVENIKGDLTDQEKRELVASTIELGVDVGTVGLGSVFKGLFKSGAKQVAKETGKEAIEKVAKESFVKKVANISKKPLAEATGLGAVYGVTGEIARDDEDKTAGDYLKSAGKGAVAGFALGKGIEYTGRIFGKKGPKKAKEVDEVFKPTEAKKKVEAPKTLQERIESIGVVKPVEKQIEKEVEVPKKVVVEKPKKTPEIDKAKKTPEIKKVEKITPVEGVAKKKEAKIEPKKEAKIKYEQLEKTSGLAKSLKSKAVRDKIVFGFDKQLRDLPTYEKRIKSEDLKKATDFVLNDYDNAVNVAMGRKTAPQGMLPEDVLVAVNEHATVTKDVELIRRLANRSGLTSEATVMGQRIQALSQLNPESAISNIQKVAKKRVKDYEKATGKKVDAVTKETVKEIKKKIKKSMPDKKDWNNFINEIEC